VGNRCANALSYCLPPIVSDGHVRRDGRRRQFARVVQNRRGIDRTVGVGRRKWRSGVARGWQQSSDERTDSSGGANEPRSSGQPWPLRHGGDSVW